MAAGNSPKPIVVTEEMISASLAELNENSFGEDPRYILESVFRAMAYRMPSASETSA